MHFPFRRAARRLGVEHRAQAVERDVGMRLGERCSGARHRVVNRALHTAIHTPTRQASR